MVRRNIIIYTVELLLDTIFYFIESYLCHTLCELCEIMWHRYQTMLSIVMVLVMIIAIMQYTIIMRDETKLLMKKILSLGIVHDETNQRIIQDHLNDILKCILKLRHIFKIWMEINPTRVNCVKYILYGTITRPVWCPEDVSVYVINNQMEHHNIIVNIQVIHRECEQSPRVIIVELLNYVFYEAVKMQMSCSPLPSPPTVHANSCCNFHLQQQPSANLFFDLCYKHPCRHTKKSWCLSSSTIAMLQFYSTFIKINDITNCCVCDPKSASLLKYMLHFVKLIDK